MTIVCNRESNNSTMLRAEQFASARSSLLSVKSLTPQDRNEGPETGRSASQEPAKSPLPCTLRTGEYGPVLTASRWRMLSKYSSAVTTLPLTGWNLYRQIVLLSCQTGDADIAPVRGQLPPRGRALNEGAAKGTQVQPVYVMLPFGDCCMALGCVGPKPLSARLLPTADRERGDRTEFDDPSL